jgi:hypothetical protein
MPTSPTDSLAPAPFERRRRRSVNLVRALELFLEKLAADFNASHVVIADASGLVQARTGAQEECYAIAAYAPLIGRTLDVSARDRLIESLSQYVDSARASNTAVRAFEVHGATLVACVVGRDGAQKDVAIARALSGARRILAA